jgi:hypothetical protein
MPGDPFSLSASEASDAQTAAELRRLKSANQDQSAEISRLKAALATYEAADQDMRGVKDSKIALKAHLSSLKALSEEQGATIQSLRAEVAAGNERLARQAAYFMEEMRRLGSGTVPTSGPARRTGPAAEPAKRPLVDRINDPRVARLVRNDATDESAGSEGGASPRRVSGFLKALDGDAATQSQAETPAASQAGTEQKDAGGADKPVRKSRLLDRITGLDKSSA